MAVKGGGCGGGAGQHGELQHAVCARARDVPNTDEVHGHGFVQHKCESRWVGEWAQGLGADAWWRSLLWDWAARLARGNLTDFRFAGIGRLCGDAADRFLRFGLLAVHFGGCRQPIRFYSCPGFCCGVLVVGTSGA